MDKIVKFPRLVVLLVILAIMLSIYGVSLYKLQIVEGAEYREASANSIVTRSTVYASRGDILDRNGKLLVTSRKVYNVILSRSEILETEDPNATLLDIIYAAVENDVVYNDTFPVTLSGPFEYTSMSETQKSRLNQYFEYFDIDPDISASDLIVWMKDHYGIEYTTNLTDARLAIGVRYELELRAIMAIPQYVFANDVDVDFISTLLGQELPGVSIETSSEREYKTPYAAHILGYVGLMNAEEYEVYKEQGYSMNAMVGKDGVEKVFEEYLHGTDGSEIITANSDGAIVDVLTTKEAVSGNNVYLTLDIDLQETAERALSETISAINAERTALNPTPTLDPNADPEEQEEEEEGMELAEGGAVVAIEVDSGETLVMASYPSYDITTFRSMYNELSSDPAQPLFNRAVQGVYNPGSTFKMVTAMAGLEREKMGRWTPFTCEGIFTKWNDYQPKCWVYPNAHGTLDMVGALENSCNHYFYYLGDKLGADAIAETATKFGLGEKTGIEIYEEKGQVATPEYKKEKLDEDWWAADTLLSAIGQGHNMFTPIQIANYTATIANGGTLYSTTLLNCVKSNDYTKLVYDNSPEVRTEQVDGGKGYIGVLQEGMRAVAATGTAASTFADFKVPVAAKTGTVQSDSDSVNDGLFVCYAPANDPQIAIAVVVENGGSGAAIMSVAEKILDDYFENTGNKEYGYFENSLIR